MIGPQLVIYTKDFCCRRKQYATERSKEGCDLDIYCEAVSARATPDPEMVLAERVFAGGRSKPFAELTAAEVKARAAELRAATGSGPTAKVGSLAGARLG